LHVSTCLPIVDEQLRIYKNIFHERDESYNIEQRYDLLLAMDHFRADVEHQLQIDVDEIIRQELIYLKLAVDRTSDRSTNKKQQTKRKKLKKRDRKMKDIVANR
jgi:hypothetical protein